MLRNQRYFMSRFMQKTLQLTRERDVLAKLLTNGYHCCIRVVCALLWDSLLINLTWKRIEWGISSWENEWNCFRIYRKGTVSAYLVRILEFRTNSKLPRQQTRWELVYHVMPIESFSRNLVRVEQFKIHSCFRTKGRPRNPHTPILKLALMDTVYTSVARVWNR